MNIELNIGLDVPGASNTPAKVTTPAALSTRPVQATPPWMESHSAPSGASAPPTIPPMLNASEIPV